MNKTLLATAVALPLLSVATFANECHPKAYSGFGIGLHGGYATSETRYSRVYNPLTVAPSNLSTTDLSGRGGLIGLDLSYGHIFANKLYAALEIKGDLQSTKGTATDGNGGFLYSSDFKAKDSYGASLKLGGLIDKALPYLLVGVATTKFENKISNALTGAAIIGETSKHKRLTAFVMGVGADFALNDRFTVGLRYEHGEYNKFSGTYATSATVVRNSFSFKPRTNTFLLNVKCRVW